MPSNRLKRGDLVRIVNPEIFVRCGYEITMETEKPIVEEQYKQALADFVQATQLTSKGRAKLIQQLAWESMRKKMRNGAERKIFTERREQYLDKEFFVETTRVVKTGTYSPASGGGGWYEDDYDPASLCKEKTHRLFAFGSGSFTPLEIEDIHCEFVRGKGQVEDTATYEQSEEDKVRESVRWAAKAVGELFKE